MKWDVVHVEAYPVEKKLFVRFRDGQTGYVRFLPSHFVGVFSTLSDPDFFSKVHVDGGAVTWPGALDLAPDAMYAAIAAQGEWTLA